MPLFFSTAMASSNESASKEPRTTTLSFLPVHVKLFIVFLVLHLSTHDVDRFNSTQTLIYLLPELFYKIVLNKQVN